MLAKSFAKHVTGTTEWQYQRVCSYKGFEFIEDHTLLPHGVQNCHVLKNEMLCCSGNANGVYPPPKKNEKKPNERKDSAGWGTCSKRHGGSRFGASGQVFINLKSADNPYLPLLDGAWESHLPKLKVEPNPAQRPWGKEDCKWFGPVDYKPGRKENWYDDY